MKLTPGQKRRIAKYMDIMSPEQICSGMQGIGPATVRKYINNIMCCNNKYIHSQKEKQKIKKILEKYGPRSLELEDTNDKLDKLFIRKSGAIAMTEVASQAGDQTTRTSKNFSENRIFIINPNKNNE